MANLFGTGHVVNPELIKAARSGLRKFAFVPGGDPAAMGGGGDPAAAAGGGGAPPMDPAAMAGGGGGGGMPPGMPPGADGGGGGGGGGGLDSVMQMMQQMQQQIQQMQAGGGAGGAGGAGGPAGALKPKIDVNVEIMQMKNMMAKLLDHAGIQMPAQDMVATPDKLMAMSQGQPTSVGGGAPGTSPGGAGGAPGGAISPIQGMQPAGVPGQGKAASHQGSAFDTAGLATINNRAAAIARIRGARSAS